MFDASVKSERLQQCRLSSSWTHGGAFGWTFGGVCPFCSKPAPSSTRFYSNTSHFYLSAWNLGCTLGWHAVGGFTSFKVMCSEIWAKTTRPSVKWASPVALHQSRLLRAPRRFPETALAADESLVQPFSPQKSLCKTRSETLDCVFYITVPLLLSKSSALH